MKLEIRCQGVKNSPRLREFVKKRLRRALGRFQHTIGTIRVYLSDVNGPRGGPDKVSRIVVELPPRGSVVVNAIDTSLRSLIVTAVGRAGLAVRRHVARRRTQRRSRRGAPLARVSF